MPKTYFSTPLSKSAKDTERRIRNIFEGQRRRPAVIVLALVAAVALLCGSLVAVRAKQNQTITEDAGVSNAPPGPPGEWEALELLPEDYSLEQAKADGCVVLEDGQITSGKERFLRFVEDCADRRNVSVRIAMHYTLGDPSRYDPEYYEEVKDSYPRLYLHDLIYDGTAYTWRWYEDGEPVERRYSDLLRMEDPPDGPGAAWDHAIRYVLVNDPNVTWGDIWRGMISSQSGAYIDHAVVYQEYVYADDALAKALERLAVADESIEFSYTQAGNTVSLIKPLNRLAYPGLMREHAQTLLRNYRYEFEGPAEFLRSGAHNALTLSGQGWQLEFWEGTDYVRLTEGDALRFYRAQPVNGQHVGDYVRGWFDEARAIQDMADSVERGGYTLLTEDEIAAWQEQLAPMTAVDGVGYATSVSCFLTSHYGNVGDIDLAEFLAYCPLAEEVTDEAEFQALSEKTGLLAGKALDTMPVPVHRYRADRINELLRQYAGITLDDLRTDWRSDPRTPYLSEYDAFYNFTSDFGPGTFYPAYGYRNGEEITLLEAGYFGDMLILAEHPDGGFWFVAHSPSGRVPQGF